MSRVINVDTGEVKVGRKGDVLSSEAIGSCVAVAVYDSVKEVGILAHVMLPGKSPSEDTSEKTRYAFDAIEKIIEILDDFGADKEGVEVCLAGGANVLERKDDTICRDNVESIIGLLKERDIKIKAGSLGGIQRRSVVFNVEEGGVYCSEGGGLERLLWQSDKI